MASNLNHSVIYGITVLANTLSIGANIVLHLCFGKLVLKSPVVVLENKSYERLIGTPFLLEFDDILNHHESFLSLMGYRVHLAFSHDTMTKGLKKIRTFLLEYSTNILSA